MLAAGAAGVLCAVFGGLILAICAAVAAAALLLCLSFSPRNRKKLVFAVVLSATFAVVAGSATISLALWERGPAQYTDVELAGKICALSNYDEDGYVVGSDVYLEDLRVGGQPIEGKACVRFAAPYAADARIGDRVRFRASMYAFAFDATNSFSVRRYRDGVKWDAVMLETDETALGVTAGKPDFAEAVKLRVKNLLYRRTNPDTAAFLFGMTFGDASDMDGEIRDAFSQTGTAHLLAVSGLHVGLIAGVVLGLMRRCRPWIKIVVMAPLLALLTALCGFSPSSVRAALMILTLLISKALGMRSDALSSVSLAALLILLVKPLYLFDMGFLMSFFAVFGIVLVEPPLRRRLGRFLPRRAAGLLSVGIAANIGLLPLLLIWFGKVSLIFVLANFLILPLISLLFPLYIGTLLLTFILPPAGALLSVVSLPFGGIVSLTELLSAVHFLTVDFVPMWYAVAPYLGLLVFASDYCMLSDKPKRLLAGGAAAVVFFASVFGLRGVTRADNVVVCGVDASNTQYVLVKSGYGNYLIYDGTLTAEYAQAIEQVLRDRHVARLDGIVAREAGDTADAARTAAILRADAYYLYRTAGLTYVPVYGASVTPEGAVFVLGEGRADAYFGEFSLTLLWGGEQPEEAFDLIVAPKGFAGDAKGAIVCDSRGYAAGWENYTPASFTFHIKNGKIIKMSAWRNA